MRHTDQPRTAGARHGAPVRFDFAAQRGAWFAACKGLASAFVIAPPLGFDGANDRLAALAHMNVADFDLLPPA